MKNQYYIGLCVKDITGNISDTEKKQLAEWLNQSALNRDEYDKIKLIWNRTTHDDIPEIPDVDTEWNKLADIIKTDNQDFVNESVTSKILEMFRPIFGTNFKPVAATVFLILIAITGWFIFNNVSTDVKTMEVATQNSVTKNLMLPDGSSVTLNSDSKIKYLNPFDENIRQVELEGEAFFSVTKSERPFVIKTNNANVKVLGTEFNVWSRGVKTKVIVEDGRVELASIEESPRKVILKKNELSELIGDEAPIEPKEVDSKYLLGWLNDKLVFDKSPLLEVSNELERHFDISLSIDDEKLKGLGLTGSFKDINADSVLTMICLALDVTYSKEGIEYVIRAKQN